ncbi:hypothetical protein F5884DRAFT_883338, partial [Xylogone sp. PMI_703]
LTGTCLYGSVKVTINDNDLFIKRRGHLCHCVNCRRVRGSHTACNLLIGEEKVEIEDQQGIPTEFIDTATRSGTPLEKFFYSRCDSLIKSVTTIYPGKVVLKMGMCL